MAQREVLVLNEDTSSVEAPQAGDSYLSLSQVADGASAVGHVFDTSNTLATSGSKIFSVRNGGNEMFSVDKTGDTLISAGGSNFKFTGGGYNPRIDLTGTDAKKLIIDGGEITTLLIGNRANGSALSITGDASAGGVPSSVLTYGARQENGLTIGMSRQGYNNTPRPIQDFILQSWDANQDATTGPIFGGDITIRAGDGAANSAGDAHGGNVQISGGTGYGTGHNGYIIMPNLPTADPALAGALWNNAGVLSVSAG